MNKPNPLVPQGTFPDKGKAQIRLTVFAILAVHLIALGVLLIAGCNKKTQTDQTTTDTGLPPVPPPPAVEPWPTPPPAVPPAPATQEVVQPTPPVIPPPETIVTPPTPLPPVPEPVPSAGLTEHTISKGDSFYTLGKKYGVGYKAIAEANPGVSPTRLKIGDKIKIPPPKTPGAAALNGTATSANGDGGVKTYKVKSGDNLGKIAKAYGVTVKQLRAANNLRTDQIKVGQTLKIPVKEPAPPPPLETIPPVPAAPPAFPPAGTPQ